MILEDENTAKQETLDLMAGIVGNIREKKEWVCFGAGETFYHFIRQYCVQAPLLPLPAYVCDNNQAFGGTEIR